MTAQERADKAAMLKSSGMCNCCQAVASVFADTVDLPPETLSQITAGFAVGMGTMEATCGALIGASIIAGLRSKGNGTVRLSKQILSSFKNKCGATICNELKGVKTGKVLCECSECVRNAVLAAEEVLN
ncbi:C_GCAxxG_C_C family probable redox protein [Treponema rectale]|uniref:C_GCAxxG_C_C family probable redox protein n=1 Tax=Treponema rectale TaxID=744512 RepID=A0A840SF26_9SPIR|nr:C-GCAxxG-C-C family protein [Treponema rectale]MBB5218758.1 C_GCAxxG_C_C family probable redox protein [Treponema rectale]